MTKFTDYKIKTLMDMSSKILVDTDGVIAERKEAFNKPKFWEINIKEINYTGKDKSCYGQIFCNGRKVYSFVGENIFSCLRESQYYLGKMENHWFDFGDPSSMEGKTILWFGIPCMILDLNEDGEIEYKDLSNDDVYPNNVFYGSRIWRTDVLSPDLTPPPLDSSIG